MIKGKLGENGYYTISVHDDLDEFFDKLCEGFEKEENVFTFGFPKLDENEMIQIVDKNENFLRTFYKFYLGENPDVPADQMALSESKSKFVMVVCSRHTFRLDKDKTPYFSARHMDMHDHYFPLKSKNGEDSEESCCLLCLCCI